MATSFLLSLVLAHPVPKDHHDRTIVVHLQSQPGSRVLVTVKYRLEVDETTVILDLRPFADEIDLSGVEDKRRAIHDFFVQKYGPILAKNLTATTNGQPLVFTCESRDHRLHDEQGQPLGHLRCDFEFRAFFTMTAAQQANFAFREDNYVLQPGLINLSLETSGLKVLEKTEADDELKKRPLTEWKPGDEEKLRGATAVLRVQTGEHADAAEVRPVQSTVPIPSRAAGQTSLLWLLDQTPWLMILLAMAFGASHALEPGHGKTLVAAYLVGERGTVWHAIVLGLVTTLTHTGAILILSLVLYFLPREVAMSIAEAIQSGIGLVLGLCIACMGAWMLLQRLSGRADHFHLGGAHHHHHGEHSHAHGPGKKGPLGWWGIILLGIVGGLIPCWAAIFLLVTVIVTHRYWLAFPLALAFSVGLAAVLIAVGVMVVKVHSFAESRWGSGRLVRALPILSALVIFLMGLWLCYDTTHSSPLDH